MSCFSGPKSSERATRSTMHSEPTGRRGGGFGAFFELLQEGLAPVGR